MTKKKILTLIGTRPQFIKYSVLSQKLNKFYNEILVDTGQHYSKRLSENFIKELQFKKPDYNLGVRLTNSIQQISEMMKKLRLIVEKVKPSFIICFGDTNSALSGALVSAKMNIPLVHVEAGERNFDREGNIVHPNSIPEETNRVIIDDISDLLLCSSKRAAENLKTEHVRGKIEFTGDIMYDLFLENIKNSYLKKSLFNGLNLKPKSYYYCTVHRVLNTDNKTRLGNIYKTLRELDKPVVFPIHPRTKKALIKFGIFKKRAVRNNLLMVEPVGYIFLSGWSAMAGADSKKIKNSIFNFKKPKKKPAFFGNGNAAAKTIQSIINWYN
jgi:UDP-GlcNAc3NAcA epimerase